MSSAGLPAVLVVAAFALLSPLKALLATAVLLLLSKLEADRKARERGMVEASAGAGFNPASLLRSVFEGPTGAAGAQGPGEAEVRRQCPAHST